MAKSEKNSIVSDTGSKASAALSQSPLAAAPQDNPARQVALDPALYLVATPIGNLRDISLRALDVLRSADHLYAEDTRNSLKLLRAFGLTRSLAAYHDHNAAKMVPKLVAQIEAGRSVALVSDAGTPLVSDPGFRLARACAAAGLTIRAVPGASAPLAALSTAALPSDRFFFNGFLPPKSEARRTALADLSAVPGTLIFFETAPRLQSSLSDMRDIFGDREAAIARELTKTYEQTRRGTLSELMEGVIADPPRGEIVVLVGPPDAGESIWDAARLDAALLAAIPERGVKRAANEVAALSGHNRREVYARALQLKDSL
ncbi:16S rRNA (cytidine(1402)-2'-O)-methyltransferase [Robiginitomaculum antarcticum]|uniref:16S rRNA (cytidine(1402)-2'-O)-methyltransferase n=1 Tax=Robiginitomaculum antarcticum TaxID=437507 RepID=UPI00036C8DF1|nr:16S rRNA (cytidine(1402)-2'-O)-methyltransferase [Robiginitomaculum antarcticum]